MFSLTKKKNICQTKTQMCQTMFRKTLLLWKTNTHYEVQKTTTSTKNFPLLAIGKCPIHNTNHSLNKYRTFRVKSTRERRGPWAISLTYVKVRASTVVPPYPRDNDWTNLNLHHLGMHPHKLPHTWLIGFGKEWF